MVKALQAPGAGFLLEIVGLFPPLFHEELGQPKMPFIPGHPVQPDQSQLNLFMAWVAPFLAFLWAKHGVNVIHQPADNLQELVFARCFVIGYGRLDKMARTIQFVVVRQVSPAVIRIHYGVVSV